jgi:hypothetical protein
MPLQEDSFGLDLRERFPVSGGLALMVLVARRIIGDRRT